MRFWRMVLFLVVAAGAVCLGWELVQGRGPGDMVQSVGSSLQEIVSWSK